MVESKILSFNKEVEMQFEQELRVNKILVSSVIQAIKPDFKPLQNLYV